MKRCDTNGDGCIGKDEFMVYYEQTTQAIHNFKKALEKTKHEKSEDSSPLEEEITDPTILSALSDAEEIDQNDTVAVAFAAAEIAEAEAEALGAKVAIAEKDDEAQARKVAEAEAALAAMPRTNHLASERAQAESMLAQEVMVAEKKHALMEAKKLEAEMAQKKAELGQEKAYVMALPECPAKISANAGMADKTEAVEADCAESVEVAAKAKEAGEAAEIALSQVEEEVKIQTRSQEAILKFNELDKDSSEQLDGDEIVQLAKWVLESLGHSVPVSTDDAIKESSKIMADCDANGDGNIDKAEFEIWYSSHMAAVLNYERNLEKVSHAPDSGLEKTNVLASSIADIGRGENLKATTDSVATEEAEAQLNATKALVKAEQEEVLSESLKLVKEKELTLTLTLTLTLIGGLVRKSETSEGEGEDRKH